MIGFIGLGIRSKPKAMSLIKAGYKLIVYDKLAILDELLSMGAEGAVSNKDVALKSNIIITMLPNLSQVKEAILGTGGVIEGLKNGSIVVDMSSVSPDLSRELAATIKTKNASFLDGTTGVTASKDKAVLEIIEPILSVMGVPFVHSPK